MTSRGDLRRNRSLLCPALDSSRMEEQILDQKRTRFASETGVTSMVTSSTHASTLNYGRSFSLSGAGSGMMEYRALDMTCEPPRQKTRMEEIAVQSQLMRGRLAPLSQADPPSKLTGKPLHQAVFFSLKQNEAILEQLSTMTSLELETSFSKDAFEVYEDDGSDGEEQPVMNRPRNRRAMRSARWQHEGGIKFQEDSGSSPSAKERSCSDSGVQPFADAAAERLKQIQESILPKKPKPSVDPSLPSEMMAPPRDLITRDGMRYSGAFGRLSEMQQKLTKEKLLLIRANPAAFQPDMADKAEAKHQTMVEVARLRYSDSVKSKFQDKEVDHFFKSLTGLRVTRPFFLPPIHEKEKRTRAAVKQAAWSLDKSWFALRKKETENKQLYDDEKIKEVQFRLDWSRIIAKDRFKRQVAILERSKSKMTKNVEEELNEVRDEISKAKDSLHSIFIYYASDDGPMDSGQVLMMTLENWMAFCTDLGLMDEQLVGRDAKNDLYRIFSAVNFEETHGNADENAENLDNACMRFEFLEAVVRAAFGTCITSGSLGLTKDASDACKLFLDRIVLSKVPAEALVDPNIFRDRMYCAEVERVFLEYVDLLNASFKLYKSRDKSKFFSIEHWAAFLEAMCLMGPHTGLDRRTAKLLFFYSQAIVSDEPKRRKRAVGLVFFDFVEAIARLADFISPVSTEELLEMRPVGGASVSPGERRERHLVILREWSLVGDRPGNSSRSRPAAAGSLMQGPRSSEPNLMIDRPGSAGIVSKPTRPLSVKLKYLLEYLTAHAMDAWGGKNVQETAQRMLEEAELLSRGIEIG